MVVSRSENCGMASAKCEQMSVIFLHIFFSEKVLETDVIASRPSGPTMPEINQP